MTRDRVCDYSCHFDPVRLQKMEPYGLTANAEMEQVQFPSLEFPSPVTKFESKD